MEKIIQKFATPLTLVMVIGLTSCDPSKSLSNRSKAPATPAPQNHEKQAASMLPHRTFLITATGIGPIKLGMSLDEARKAFQEGKFERASDGDGAALIDVLLGKDSLMTLYAGEEDPDKPIDWSKKITVIESFNPACVSEAGLRIGALVLDAEKIYGKTKSITRSDIESREYIEFQNNPEHLTFRIDYTGVFPEGSRETTQFNPQAKIHSITVSSR